jgi:hypothetical protein
LSFSSQVGPEDPKSASLDGEGRDGKECGCVAADNGDEKYHQIMGRKVWKIYSRFTMDQARRLARSIHRANVEEPGVGKGKGGISIALGGNIGSSGLVVVANELNGGMLSTLRTSRIRQTRERGIGVSCVDW